LQNLLFALVVSVAAASTLAAHAVPIPPSFQSAGADRSAIEALLATYTRAVSSKDRALFETLLLNRTIPFSGVPLPRNATQNYDDFRQGVFAGPPFTQRFQDVHIDQDGPLAAVSLVFVNTTPQGSSWGYKTLQLLKIDGRWKIASEFYTGHPG
jgi:ketosteroid isomerase-like protein